MYKITKTVDDAETITLNFDDILDAQKVFSHLQYDEYIRFKKLYSSGIKKEIREDKLDGDIIYKEYKLSISSFSVTIALEYVEN